MAAGIQVWDANGVLTLDTNYRIGRFYGVINNAPLTGSVQIPSGIPIAVHTAVAQESFSSGTAEFWTSGTTLHWRIYGLYPEYSTHTIYYGGF